MKTQPNPNQFWPVIDRQRRHIRTAGDTTVIPFDVIGILACTALILFGTEATFGITNWVTIPAGVAAWGWAIERCDNAAIHYAHNRLDEPQDQP